MLLRKKKKCKSNKLLVIELELYLNQKFQQIILNLVVKHLTILEDQ